MVVGTPGISSANSSVEDSAVRAGSGGMNQEPETPKGEPVQMDLYVSLKDLYLGNTIKVIRDKDVLKPAKGTRKCNCRQKMVTDKSVRGCFSSTRKTSARSVRT